jgi:pyruvate kinase
MVGYSFVQRAQDIVLPAGRDGDAARRLATAGSDCQGRDPGAVRNLPEIMVQAARWQPLGVMIARGDLALGLGFPRLAEMQERPRAFERCS